MHFHAFNEYLWLHPTTGLLFGPIYDVLSITMGLEKGLENWYIRHTRARKKLSIMPTAQWTILPPTCLWKNEF